MAKVVVLFNWDFRSPNFGSKSNLVHRFILSFSQEFIHLVFFWDVSGTVLSTGILVGQDSEQSLHLSGRGVVAPLAIYPWERHYPTWPPAAKCGPLPWQSSRGHVASESEPGGTNLKRGESVIQELACVLTFFSDEKNWNTILLGKKIWPLLCLKVFSNLEKCFSLWSL